ncbi:uncharacterized protein MELLADRAFT_123770 [Melampsora larici-populina 98AG31]|uniref:Secreted protein n=1 Tax=Melampsora larici-populina (strain 98AG31 / pathotype 3-4-7) TaxID=747676 RepID=F4RLQ6_MELLP|nr:uncharacterized protein MELLADRAFT_123770 [Melampsora larici-populina 98AG31]EGG06578.1 secreted protein [Melampsora larici-populina 98AG31]
MLHVSLKISLLLVSLLFNNSWVLASNPEYTPRCNKKFWVDQNGAHCKELNIDTYNYNCDYSTCWYNNHQYIPMSGCQLEHSPDKSTSDQECVQYEHLTKYNTYSCKNSGVQTYICPYKADIPAIECTVCSHA